MATDYAHVARLAATITRQIAESGGLGANYARVHTLLNEIAEIAPEFREQASDLINFARQAYGEFGAQYDSDRTIARAKLREGVASIEKMAKKRQAAAHGKSK